MLGTREGKNINMKTHNIGHDCKGQGMDRNATPVCSCGWRGYPEYAYNDYMYTNLKEQKDKHLKDSAEENK